MSHAAAEMKRAAGTIDGTMFRLIQKMDEFTCRMEDVATRIEAAQAVKDSTKLTATEQKESPEAE